MEFFQLWNYSNFKISTKLRVSVHIARGYEPVVFVCNDLCTVIHIPSLIELFSFK